MTYGFPPKKPEPLLTPSERAARLELQRELAVIRSIRFGILQSMERIRKVLMVKGEWHDPCILPLDRIHYQMTRDASNQTVMGVIVKSAHEHSLRWVLKQDRRAKLATVTPIAPTNEEMEEAA